MTMDIGSFFDKATNSLNEAGNKMSETMDKLASSENLSQGDMLQMQYELAMFNTRTELTSSIIKATTDTMKSLAQRTG